MIVFFAVEIFSTVLQRIFCENTLMKRECKGFFEIIVWSGYLIIINLVSRTIPGLVWLNMLVFVLAFFVAIKILYNNPTKTLLAVTFFLYIIRMCSELLVFCGIKLQPWLQEADDEIFRVVLSRMVWFCVIKLSLLLIKIREIIEVNFQDWLQVFMIPIGSVCILLALFEPGMWDESFLGLLAVVIILIINISTYYLYDQAKEAMEKRIREEILIQQCEYDIWQNEESKEWWEELRHFRHDMKQRYLLEKAYLEAGNYNALEQYCNENLEFLSRKSRLSDTGNIYIDSIINYKADVAKRHSIEFIVNLEIPRDVQLNAEDLCICLGNLLDNAIEASLELEENKVIRIEMQADGSNLFINIRNNYQKERQKNNKKYVTSKNNTKSHGFGMTIIQKIVDKYEGEFMVNEVDNEFEAIVLLYDFLK